MSKHKTPLTELERKGLEAHGLGKYIGQPSQLADVFRQGVAWALANNEKESVQKPVAWLHPANATCVTTDPTAYTRGIPLYKKIPDEQQQWVGLTEKEYVEVTAQHFGKNGVSWFEDSLPSFVKDIEAKLKEKNS